MSSLQNKLLNQIAFCLIFIFLISVARAENSCFNFLTPDVFYNVHRFGYLNIAGGPAMWFESELIKNEDGDFVWSFRPNFYQSELFYNINGPRSVNAWWSAQSIANTNLEQSTLFKAQLALEFVYSIFLQEATSRSSFSDDFLVQLRKEDQSRIETATSFWVIKDSDRKPVAAWGLYKKASTSKRTTYELIRLAIDKNFPFRFNIKEAMALVSEYLEAIKVKSGVLEIKTDKAGARLYRILGAQIVNEYEPGKFLLTVEIETFLKIFPATRIKNGSREVLSSTMLDEVFYY